MAEDNRNKDDGGKKGGTEFRVPPRTYILWIAILGAIPLLMVFKNTGPTQADLLNQVQFTQYVRSNLVVEGKIIYDAQNVYLQDVEGKYKKYSADGKFEIRPFRARVRLTDRYEDELRKLEIFEVRQVST